MRNKAHVNDGKTLSKKAQIRAGLLLKAQDSPASSHPGSRRTSRPSSRPSSRPISRYASEDEDGSLHGDLDDFDDSLTLSTASGEFEEEEASFAAAVDWPSKLHACIADLTGKRINDASHEANLETYLQVVRRHVARDEIQDAGLDLFKVLLKSIKSGNSVRERVLALDALAVTIITYNSKSFSDTASVWKLVRSPLTTVCETAEDETVKVHAIRALATAFVFDCRSREAAEQLLEFLVEIIESDGHAIEADDSSPVVIAAMQAWSFVADVFSDKGGDAGRAMEAFNDQLESSVGNVQLAAANQLAFLFEAAREPESDEENESDSDGERLDLPYQPGNLMSRLITAARGNRSGGSRGSNGNWFRRLIGSVDEGLPLRHQTVWRNDATGGWIVVEVDTMSTWVRMEHLKATLGKGLKEHLLGNPMVAEILEDADVEKFDQEARPRKPVWGNPDSDVKDRLNEMGLHEGEEYVMRPARRS